MKKLINDQTTKYVLIIFIVLILSLFSVVKESTAASGKSILKYGMTPISPSEIKDGTYDFKVISDSAYFTITKAKLVVKNGKMKAKITLSSKSYRYVYPGDAADANFDEKTNYIKGKEENGVSTFTIPVPALNKLIPCAAFSKRRKKWYDRNLLFDASNLPKKSLSFDLPNYDTIDKAIKNYKGNDTHEKNNSPSSGSQSSSTDSASDNYRHLGKNSRPVSIPGKKDGEYSIEVTMTGGSGKASVSSPTKLIIKDGKAYAKLLWSSSHYDYVIAGGKKFTNETKGGGNSTFTIPITALNKPMPIIANTTAMGSPVEINYNLTFYQDSIAGKNMVPQEAAKNVLIVALIIIILGGIINHFIKKLRS